jgi:MFS transporter, putative metabolite:H+ symporter
MMNLRQQPLFVLSVAAAALGYFVDLYDIVIFGVVRVSSLTELGLTGQDNTDWGVALLNLQMIGMLLGGFFWGVVGDRMGRRFALLATITLYSLANLANAFVVNVEQYAVLRFLAGVGLAGELGAGVTLVSELLPRHLRGYGTTVIAVLGLLGALTASYVGAELHWRMAYLAGGVMGFLVLGMRWIVLRESAMFEEQKSQALRQGDLRLLFGRWPTLLKFAAVTAIGVPIWYISALFVNLAPEYGRALGFAEPLTVAAVLRYQALGLAIGSGASGLLSEWMQSRKKILYLCFSLLLALVLALMNSGSVESYCLLMFAIGLAQGYWTAFIIMAAEQFGTNIRATVSTSVPNIVRAMTVPVTLSVLALWPLLGLVPATLLVGAVVFGLAYLALYGLRETYGKDLNYTER